jgi:hypothetical protein
MTGHVDTSSRKGHVSIRIIRYIADEMELEFTVTQARVTNQMI